MNSPPKSGQNGNMQVSFESAMGIVRNALSQDDSQEDHAAFNAFVGEFGYVLHGDSDSDSDDEGEEEDSGSEDDVDDSDDDSDGEEEDDVFIEYGDMQQGGEAVLLQLHDPIHHNLVCCPPCDIQLLLDHSDHECDCETRHMLTACCLDNDFVDISGPDLDWANVKQTALETADNPNREPNNILRKRMYRLVFSAMDFGGLEKGERRRLPNCTLAFIRSVYPSSSGKYMGYKEA